MKQHIAWFSKVPVSDTCWSLTSGPGDIAYAGICCEHTGGVSAYVASYDAATKKMDYLVDVADAVGDPADSGRATQCKIHYSMVVDKDNIMYGASHLSGPPIGDFIYNPWGSWMDPVKAFRGAGLFVYDITHDRLLWSDILIQGEGCRALALDSRRGRLYSASYPRDHFHVYDLESREDLDLGRFGSVNPQAIWLDSEGNGYTTDDFGRILKFDAEKNRLEELDLFLTHPAYQDGWHTVVYDVVQAPDGESVVGVSWQAAPHFFRHVPAEGRVDDLGPAQPGKTGYEPSRVNGTHVGGLAFGPDGFLYYGMQTDDPKLGVYSRLWRMNTETGEREDLGPIVDPETDTRIRYISRSVWVNDDDLVMGVVSHVPSGLSHVRMEPGDYSGPITNPRPGERFRTWG